MAGLANDMNRLMTVADGWQAQHPRGFISAAHKAYEELEELTQADDWFEILDEFGDAFVNMLRAWDGLTDKEKALVLATAEMKRRRRTVAPGIKDKKAERILMEDYAAQFGVKNK